MKRKLTRKPYSAPNLSILAIDMEQGIAATSVGTINPGSSSTPNNPKVEDWTDKGNNSKDFDI
ncbi:MULTISPECIES: hypothetical protein [Sphingobacterium]|uniref:hypothetical protein n=1 Tax=Sphingobacterium TaxID=28453 RepID=UPI0009588423|nr:MULTISPECIES: hypothetical protein [Sphingobacterium]APU95241.1 hypothetical protein BV902_01930 [Sphingobacterium sp. B29]QQT30808.1 hypothetical protein I6I99_26590 [Sphingobacterium multivorum]UQA75555.1 hypothetical protein K2F45_00640 [Sphingobacterium siyangense]